MKALGAMIPRVLTALLILWLGGCDDRKSAESSLASATAAAPTGASGEASSSGPPASTRLAVGAKIVASFRPEKTSFRQGKVVALVGSTVTYEYGQQDERSGSIRTANVGTDRVWLIGAGLTKPAAVGEPMICRTSPARWTACSVLAAEGASYRWVDTVGGEHRSSARALVRPTGATSRAIKSYFARRTRHGAWDKAIRAVGKPTQPADWRPQVRDRVVAQWVAPDYYGATITKIKSSNTVTISWQGHDMWNDVDRSVPEIAPQPRGPQPVRKGQFVLLKPRAPSQSWRHYRVLSVAGTTVVLRDEDDQDQTVDSKNVVPLQP